MSWLFSPLAIRLLATLLLVLDLSQEPTSALPVAPSPFTDNDTIADLSTKEAFWWDSSAAVGHEFTMALLSRQSAVQVGVGVGQIPRPTIQAVSATNVVACPPAAPARIAFLLPLATAPPADASTLIATGHLAVEPFLYRNSALAHRRSVVLTV